MFTHNTEDINKLLHWILWLVFRALFWCKSFPTLLNMETYRVSYCIHLECCIIWARPTQIQALFMQLTSELCFIILIPLYCKFTVISWLNDCEDMKLVVPTHIICFINTRVYLKQLQLYYFFLIFLTLFLECLFKCTLVCHSSQRVFILPPF